MTWNMSFDNAECRMQNSEFRMLRSPLPKPLHAFDGCSMGVVTQIIDLDNSSTIKNEECRMIRCGGNDNVGVASYSMCFGCHLEQVSVANASKDLPARLQSGTQSEHQSDE